MFVLLKRVGLLVKYIDNVKLFISFINIGIVSCVLLFFFILYEFESVIVIYFFFGEFFFLICDVYNFIGYVDVNDFVEYIKKVELMCYNMYCLKKIGVGQWSIYVN